MRRRRTELRALLPAALLPLVAACSLAPKYELPTVPVAEQYKEAGTDSRSPWQLATPGDRLPRGRWWSAFGDPALDALATRLERDSPDLAAAVARFDQAQAFRDQARSALFPTLSIGAESTRNRQSDTRPPSGNGGKRYYSAHSAGLQLGYELDLWGRARNAANAGDAHLQAAAADLEALRLGLQAALVDAYIQLRALDSETLLLRDTVEAYRKAVELTETRHQAGAASGLDLARAQTQLQNAKVEAATLKAARAQLEHAIAVLVGQSPSGFALAEQAVGLQQPTIPLGLPSTLLLRRPDVAAAERRAAAANAEIGIARAAWFPSFTLGGSTGYQSYTRSDWFSAPSSFWSLGPSLALSLFDGGLRRAQVAQARAAFEAASADYRATALQAFAQVEDQLAELTYVREAATEETGAVESSQRALDYAMTRYRAGAVNYLEVVTAQTAALDAQRGMVDLQTRQLRASVALIRAVGGGWSGGEDSRASATP